MATYWRLVICLILACLFTFSPEAAVAQGTSPQPRPGQQRPIDLPELVTGQTFYGLPGIEQRLAP